MKGGIRVVSMPCWELFEEQTEAYRASVLPKCGGKATTAFCGVLLQESEAEKVCSELLVMSAVRISFARRPVVAGCGWC